MSTYGRMNSIAAHIDRGMKEEGARTGTYIYHTPALRCSCNGEDGQPSVSCRVCGGDGFFHPTHLEKKRLVIITQAVNTREFVVGPGIFEREDIVVSFMDRFVVAAQDRIRFDREDLFHLVTPAEGFVLERGNGLFDALPQRVARLLQVVRSNQRTGAVTYFRPGIDVLVEGNKLRWVAKQIPVVPGVTMPPKGETYSITYHGDYDFIVVENLAPRHIANVSLGTRALCRRRLTDQRNIEREAPVGPSGFNPALYVLPLFAGLASTLAHFLPLIT